MSMNVSYLIKAHNCFQAGVPELNGNTYYY